MTKKTKVFTPEEVKNLNLYQEAGVMHPFTCGGDRCDENHADGEGRLVATVYGWICPYCGYTQDWAHDFMKQFDPNKHALLGLRAFSSALTAANEASGDDNGVDND